jgi:hypothetical protein
VSRNHGAIFKQVVHVILSYTRCDLPSPDEAIRRPVRIGKNGATIVKLTHLGTVDSGKSGSPTAFATDRGTFLIQGWKVTDTDALNEARHRGLPDHEDIVEVPAELLTFLPGRDSTEQ